jgi:hypothetical protein
MPATDGRAIPAGTRHRGRLVVRRLRRAWREVRWPVPGALAFAALVFGYIGFDRYD